MEKENNNSPKVTWGDIERTYGHVMTVTKSMPTNFDINEAKRVSEEARALLEESRKKAAEVDIALNIVMTSRKSASDITPADVKYHAYRQAIRMAEGNKQDMFDLKSSWGKEMARRVKTYLSFHKSEIVTIVELHQARAKRNRHVSYLESKWKSNILSNSLYVAYKSALANKHLRHLRVRAKMLSICTGKDKVRDCRNMIATSSTDLKVLSILRNRRVDKVDEKWY